MTTLAVVADASAVIALNQIGLLHRVSPLFSECIVPEAVASEVARSVSLPSWISPRSLSQPIDSRIVDASLDPGESEVLALALELGGRSVLIDEQRARRVARDLGLPVVGTVGLIVRAKHDGIVASVRPSIEALLRSGFFLSASVIQQSLREAGEQV